jgi:hypothetical protein
MIRRVGITRTAGEGAIALLVLLGIFMIGVGVTTGLM